MVRARVNGGSNYDSLNGTNSQLSRSQGGRKEAWSLKQVLFLCWCPEGGNAQLLYTIPDIPGP